MAANDQLFIAYCLKQGYISMDDVKDFMDSKFKGKNAILFIAKKLGWDKNKVMEELRLSQNQKNTAPESTVTEEEIHDSKRTLGKYIILRKLGAGGMGTVYKAYHPDLETYFAIKTINSDGIDQEHIKRFKREAKISSRLRHPNIVRVYDVGIEEDKHYIVMDYIHGKDLSKLIGEGKLLFRKTLKIILKISQALEYAHDMKVIHRDIKPSNILIADDDEGTPYLMDFGLASIIQKGSKLTRTGQVLGTPQYMSPEQALGKELDGRSDIYSLGTVLYEMLTCIPTVKAASNFALLCLMIVNEDPILPSKQNNSISKDLEAITMKCLEKDPWRRYQTAGDLARDLERYLEGEAVYASYPTPLYRVWRKAKRSWKLMTVIGTSVILVIGVVILWILSLQKQARELEKTKEAQVKELERTKEEALKVIKDKINETWNDVNKQERLEKFDKALELCKTLIDWDPTDNRFSKKLIEITQKKDIFQKNKEDQQKEARRYYDRAMEVFWNPRLDENELERCKGFFEKAIQEYPMFADAHFQAGRAAHRLFNIEEAIKHYRNSLKCDPNLTPSKYYMTVLEFSTTLQRIADGRTNSNELHRKFEDIWGYPINKVSQEATDPYPLLGKAFFLLASIKGQKSRNDASWNECLECCNRVIAEHPDFSDAYIIRAQLCSYWIGIYKGEFQVHSIFDPVDLDQALKDCSHALYLDPYRNEVYALRGAIYKSIGSYDTAEKDYTRALILKRRTQANFYRERAICYIAMGKENLAMGDLEKNKDIMIKTEASVTKSEAFLWKALVKSGLNEKKEAEDSLTKYLSLRPSDSNVAQFDGFIKMLVYLSIDEEVKRAEEAFRSFSKDKKGILKLIQVFTQVVKNRSKLSINEFEDIPLILKDFSNILCLAPNLKQLLKEIPEIISFTKSIPYLGDSNIESPEFSIIMRRALENLLKKNNREENLKRINVILNQEYPPLTTELFIYFLAYISEKGNIRTIMRLKELPSASLYYRRAIEFYFRSKTPKESKKTDDNPIKEEDDLDKARCDLEAALELEPCYMEAHYGLATVYSLLSESDHLKKATYKESALYYLRQAVENGWNHLEDYTLKDDDFKPLGLGKEVSLETLHSWEKIRQTNKEQIKMFENKIRELISRGKVTWALRLLYKSEYSSLFNELTESTETKVMDYFKNMKDKNESEIERKIELLFGERGKTMWEETKRQQK